MRVQQDTPEGRKPGRDCELSGSLFTYLTALLPPQPPSAKNPPLVMEAGLRGLRLSLLSLLHFVVNFRRFLAG